MTLDVSIKEWWRSRCITPLEVIVGLLVFGLTESWIYRAPMISLYLLYFVTLATIVSKGFVERY
ncbi:MAG: hypothetical protein JKX75_02200 [Gammaproteobacteria bacterium]|nr:hypothetical protein [Gammaproteobacteria bacterium]